MTRFWVFSVVFFFLTLITVFSAAATLQIEKIAVTNEVDVGGIAVFQLTLQNKGTERDVFSIQYDPYEVGVYSAFAESVRIEPPQVKVEAGSSAVALVSLSVSSLATPDKEYPLHLTITSLTDSALSETIELVTFVVAPKNVISIGTDLPDALVPGEHTDITLHFKNRLNIPLDDYLVDVASEAPGISASFVTSFAPKEEKTRTITIAADRSTKPGDYGFTVGVYKDNLMKGSYLGAFTVQGTPIIEEKKEERSGFLTKELILTKKNVGNTVALHRIEISSPFLKRLFTSTQPDATFTGNKMVWEHTLQPREEFTVHVYYNYRSVFYGLLVVSFFTILFLFFVERSVVVKKRIYRVQEHEGTSELKILLHIRNGKRVPLDETVVMDFVPHFITLVGEYGTLSPTKIQKGMKSHRLLWELGTLSPKEERVISYKVRARLDLIGAVLPVARLTYRTGSSYSSATSARVVLDSTSR